MSEDLSVGLPESVSVEKALLGCLLIDPGAIYLIESISTKDFYDPRHALIFETFQELFLAGESTDIVSIGARIKEKKTDKKIGGYAYLAELTNIVPTSSHITHYAKTVKDKSVRRQILAAQEATDREVRDETKDIDLILANVQSTIVAIDTVKVSDDSAPTIVGELKEAQAEYQKKYAAGKKYFGFECGFEEIDNAVDGMRPGHVWVVGGWTSTGKTQFALNIVHSVLSQNVPVSIISLEMSRVDTVARIIGIRNKMSSMMILKGKTSNFPLEEYAKVEEGLATVALMPLQVHTTYFQLEKIKMIIRKDAYNHKTKLFVIDYVQNVQTENGMSEYETMTAAAVDLQALARELGVTIYIVSQISNESKKGMGAGSGFKGTGALEAVADLAIRLERDTSKEDPSWEDVPLAVKIAKNRHGFGGTTEYMFHLKSGKVWKSLLPAAMINATKKR